MLVVNALMEALIACRVSACAWVCLHNSPTLLHFIALLIQLCTFAAQQPMHVTLWCAGSHIVTHLKLVEKVRATCVTQCVHVVVHS